MDLNYSEYLTIFFELIFMCDNGIELMLKEKKEKKRKEGREGGMKEPSA